MRCSQASLREHGAVCPILPAILAFQRPEEEGLVAVPTDEIVPEVHDPPPEPLDQQVYEKICLSDPLNRREPIYISMSEPIERLLSCSNPYYLDISYEEAASSIFSNETATEFAEALRILTIVQLDVGSIRITDRLIYMEILEYLKELKRIKLNEVHGDMDIYNLTQYWDMLNVRCRPLPLELTPEVLCQEIEQTISLLIRMAEMMHEPNTTKPGTSEYRDYLDTCIQLVGGAPLPSTPNIDVTEDEFRTAIMIATGYPALINLSQLKRYLELSGEHVPIPPSTLISESGEGDEKKILVFGGLAITQIGDVILLGNHLKPLIRSMQENRPEYVEILKQLTISGNHMLTPNILHFVLHNQIIPDPNWAQPWVREFIREIPDGISIPWETFEIK